MAIGKHMNLQARHRGRRRFPALAVAVAVLCGISCASADAQNTANSAKPADSAVQKKAAEGFVKLTQSANLRERAARDEAYKKKLCGKIKSQLENFESHQRMGRAPDMLRMRLELATTCSSQPGYTE